MKYLLLIICFLFSLQLYAEKNCIYNIDKKSIEFKWTGYKFTEKAPVSGTFKEIDWNIRASKNLNDLISKLQFKINTKSVDSKNSLRDKRLYRHFFKLMKNGEEIKGYGISFDKSTKQAIIEVNMNGERTPIALTSKMNEDLTFSLLGKIDIINDYKMLKAFKSISSLCKALHTGEDGVSKTWSEVGVSINGKIIKSCKQK